MRASKGVKAEYEGLTCGNHWAYGISEGEWKGCRSRVVKTDDRRLDLGASARLVGAWTGRQGTKERVKVLTPLRFWLDVSGIDSKVPGILGP